METINRRYIWFFFAVLLFILVGAYILNMVYTPPLTKPGPIRSETGEISTYYEVQDESGHTILQTGLPVSIDDQYIDENNVCYLITRVEGKTAQAIINSDGEASTAEDAVSISVSPLFNPSIPVQAGTTHHVVVYHTHTDESYTPTSGKASQPAAGDIYTIGNVLADSLQKSGVSVSHNTAAHDPHDVHAYNRSRRTLAQLLQEQPDAAFDIHRDSAPASAYLTTVNGVETSRIMMVVGRSNPNSQTNLAYARTIKAKADTLYPGLIRGIFMGKGSYNQDLYPTSMLFEMGTEEIPIEPVENAARFLGDVIINVLNGT
jgi:stage II sporulation protein P